MISHFLVLFIGLLIALYLCIQIDTLVNLRRFFKKCDKTIDLFELALKLEREAKSLKNVNSFYIEVNVEFKKMRFNTFNDFYTYIEKCANETLDYYEKVKDLDDDNDSISVCKDAMMEIIMFIRKKRWLKQ